MIISLFVSCQSDESIIVKLSKLDLSKDEEIQKSKKPSKDDIKAYVTSGLSELCDIIDLSVNETYVNEHIGKGISLGLLMIRAGSKQNAQKVLSSKKNMDLENAKARAEFTKMLAEKEPLCIK